MKKAFISMSSKQENAEQAVTFNLIYPATIIMI